MTPTPDPAARSHAVAGGTVAVTRADGGYPEAPFHPDEFYPEYPFGRVLSDRPNPVYAAVRQAFRRLGLDASRFGTSSWNPLGSIVDAGRPVLLKPNFVNHVNPGVPGPRGWSALVTQGAVIRAVLDYVLIALGGRGQVVIADLPMQSARMDDICRNVGLPDVFAFVSAKADTGIQILDLRRHQMLTTPDGAVIREVSLPGDPDGYVNVDLETSSSLEPLSADADLFRAPDYPGLSTREYHAPGRHVYVLPRTVLRSGTFICLPKLKTHRKVGVTLSMKNLVGTIGNKACLPHYRAGSPATGGDEYPVDSAVNRLRSRWSLPMRRLGPLAWRLIRPVGRAVSAADRARRGEGDTPIAHGDWHGNDTAWRMVHDLNRVLAHADESGQLHQTRQRRYLSVVDGVVGGEGAGPLLPAPVDAGLVIAGTDPLAVDACATRLMGLDWRRVPQLARYDAGLPLGFSCVRDAAADVEVLLDSGAYALDAVPYRHPFRPSAGWRGRIEVTA
jgi:uncharacterized protein (DUF362 family)